MLTKTVLGNQNVTVNFHELKTHISVTIVTEMKKTRKFCYLIMFIQFGEPRMMPSYNTITLFFASKTIHASKPTWLRSALYWMHSSSNEAEFTRKCSVISPLSLSHCASFILLRQCIPLTFGFLYFILP